MAYKIKWEDKGLLITFSEIFSYELKKEVLLKCLEDSRKFQVKYVISDFTDVKEIVLNDDKLYSLALDDKFTSINFPNLKIANIIKPEFQETFLRILNNSPILNSNWIYEIFYNIDNARKWVETK